MEKGVVLFGSLLVRGSLESAIIWLQWWRIEDIQKKTNSWTFQSECQREADIFRDANVQKSARTSFVFLLSHFSYGRRPFREVPGFCYKGNELPASFRTERCVQMLLHAPIHLISQCGIFVTDTKQRVDRGDFVEISSLALKVMQSSLEFWKELDGSKRILAIGISLGWRNSGPVHTPGRCSIRQSCGRAANGIATKRRWRLRRGHAQF